MSDYVAMEPGGGSLSRGRHGVLVALVALLLAALWVPQAWADGEDPGAALLDPGFVAAIDLTVGADELAALEADPGEYQPASLEIRTGAREFGPLTVGLRLKGTGSFRGLDGKAAFKVKFAEYVKGQRVDGLKGLTLNNMIQDHSMVAETLSYEIFRNFGVAAPRTGYAFVRLNGVPYGLYANVENLDDVWLPRWFGSTGHLYEADAWATELLPGEAETFEVEEGDEGDLSDLEALIEAANAADGDWSEQVEAVADLTQMTRMWAVERYIGHWDGYAGRVTTNTPNNYFLHSDENGVFSMTPWGTDQTWVERLAFDQPGGLLFDRCLADASCAELYRGALTALGPLVAGLGLDRLATATAALLAPCQSQESPQRRESSRAEIAAALADVRAFVAERPAELAAWLGAGQPPLGDEPPRATGFQPCESAPHPEDEEDRPAPEANGPKPKPKQAGPRSLGGVLAAKASRRAVVVRAQVNGRGGVAVRVDARVNGRWRHACTVRRAHAGTGRVTLRCRLAQPLQRQAGDGMRLRARIRFRSSEGDSRVVVRQLRLAPHAGL